MKKRQEIIGISYFAETLIVRHNKTVSDKSIHHNDLVYWSERDKALRNSAFSKSILRILRNQNNKCKLCNLKFLPSDVIEINYIVSKALRGASHYGNLQALHGHCHGRKPQERGAV
jgi:RNA-directed DNA polymerase